MKTRLANPRPNRWQTWLRDVPPRHLLGACLAFMLALPSPARAELDSEGSSRDTPSDGSLGGGGDVGLAIQYTAVVSDAKEAQTRAMNSLAYANSFTCAAAAPYQAAAQAAVDQANAEVTKLDKSLTIADAEQVRSAAELAAAEATRNGWLAAQACGAPIPPDIVLYASPFDGLANPLPTWDNTFWDISSP